MKFYEPIVILLSLVVGDCSAEIGTRQTACLTAEECYDKSRPLWAIGVRKFATGNYDSYGCYFDGDTTFFGFGGTVESMSAPLDGKKKRIWCGTTAQQTKKDGGPLGTLAFATDPTSEPSADLLATNTTTLYPSTKPTPFPTPPATIDDLEEPSMETLESYTSSPWPTSIRTNMPSDAPIQRTSVSDTETQKELFEMMQPTEEPSLAPSSSPLSSDQSGSRDPNSIHCIYRPRFDTADHGQACREVDNEHIVPFACDGEFERICCTVSIIESLQFNRFGNCQMIGGGAEEERQPTQWPTTALPTTLPTPRPTSDTETQQELFEMMQPQTQQPSRAPTPRPSSEQSSVTDPNSIHCVSRPWFNSGNHAQACLDWDNGHVIPYECDSEEFRKVCCTVSNIVSPAFKTFGQCYKVGGSLKPTKMPTQPPLLPTRDSSARPTPIGQSASGSVCLKQKMCNKKRREMNFDKYFVGNYPSKGCYFKGDTAYWGTGGTEEEKSEPLLAGGNARIWCSDDILPALLSQAPTKQPANAQLIEPVDHCIDITVVTDKYGKDETGFSLSTKPDIGVPAKLVDFPVGSLQNEATHTKRTCVPPGSYTFTVEDSFFGLCCSFGKGSFRVSLDGAEIISGGHFREKSVSYTIVAGYSPRMNADDTEWLQAHNTRRKVFHEEHSTEYRPLVWSRQLAQEASTWADVVLNNQCQNVLERNVEEGQNQSARRYSGETDTEDPEDIVFRWTDRIFDLIELGKDPNVQPLTQVMWRASRYLGCSNKSTRYADGSYCYVSVCRYARAGNCFARDSSWLRSTLQDYTSCGEACPKDGCY